MFCRKKPYIQKRLSKLVSSSSIERSVPKTTCTWVRWCQVLLYEKHTYSRRFASCNEKRVNKFALRNDKSVNADVRTRAKKISPISFVFSAGTALKLARTQKCPAGKGRRHCFTRNRTLQLFCYALSIFGEDWESNQYTRIQKNRSFVVRSKTSDSWLTAKNRTAQPVIRDHER